MRSISQQYCSVVFPSYTERIMRLQVLFSTIRYNSVQFRTVRYTLVLFSTIQYNSVLFSTIWYNSVQFRTVWYTLVLFSTIQYNSVQFGTIQYYQWSGALCLCTSKIFLCYSSSSTLKCLWIQMFGTTQPLLLCL